jgi:hypothetical protein
MQLSAASYIKVYHTNAYLMLIYYVKIKYVEKYLY